MQKRNFFMVQTAILIGAFFLSGCQKNDVDVTDNINTETQIISEQETKESDISSESSVNIVQLQDGDYSADVILGGGSGRASVDSPAKITVKDKKVYATIVWSSNNYDYMVVDGEKYLNESTDGNSSFTIPVAAFEKELPVTGDTTAMSTPHEIDYTLYFELKE